MQMMAHEFMNAASAVAQQPVAALSTQGWAYGCSESGGDWACFEPLSPCGEAERAAAPPAAFEGGPGDALPAGAPSPPANLNGPRWWALMQAYVFTLSAEQRARIRCLHAALGLTFPCADGERRRGQLAARLGAPLDAAAEARAAAHAPCVAAADDAAASLFPRDAGCLSVGMHVRLGDRRVHDSRLHGLDEYVAAVAALGRRGLRLCTAVVASDDEEVLGGARAMLSAVMPEGARVVILPTRVARPDATAVMADWLSRQPVGVRRNATEDIVDIIATLSETNVFIGICMSQVARTIAALQYVYGVAAHAPIGVDTKECLEFVGHSPAIEEGWVSLDAL